MRELWPIQIHYFPILKSGIPTIQGHINVAATHTQLKLAVFENYLEEALSLICETPAYDTIVVSDVFACEGAYHLAGGGDGDKLNGSALICANVINKLRPSQ